MGVLDEGEQEMLEGRIFVPAAARFREGGMQGLFEFAGEGRQFDLLLKPARFTDCLASMSGLGLPGIKRTPEKAGEKAECSPASVIS